MSVKSALEARKLWYNDGDTSEADVSILSSQNSIPRIQRPRHSGPNGRRPPGAWRTLRRPRELVTVSGWRGAIQLPGALVDYPSQPGLFIRAKFISPMTTVNPPPYIP